MRLPNEVKNCIIVYSKPFTPLREFLLYNCVNPTIPMQSATASLPQVSSIYYMFFKEYYFTFCIRLLLDEYTQICNIKINKILTNKNYKYTIDNFDMAAYGNCLHVIKWLYEYRAEKCSPDAINYAAMNGNIDIITYLIDNNASYHMDVIECAILFGHVNIIKYFIDLNKSFYRSDWHAMTERLKQIKTFCDDTKSTTYEIKKIDWNVVYKTCEEIQKYLFIDAPCIPCTQYTQYIPLKFYFEKNNIS